jgi:hypothetical protein
MAFMAVSMPTFSAPGNPVKIKITRNPFMFHKKVRKIYPRVEMITISENEKAVAISGKRYTIGDKIRQCKIESIVLEYIVLDCGTMKKRIFVNERIK